MTSTAPMALSLPEILRDLGQVGTNLSELGACEGAAGNLSVYVSGVAGLGKVFPDREAFLLPIPLVGLPPGVFFVTGSGSRLKEIADAPEANLGCIRVEDGGRSATLLTSPKRSFTRLTSELNSHLAVHYAQLMREPSSFHGVVHAQPKKLTYLTHLPRYRDKAELNRRLLRWQPEAILNFPNGVGLVPFLVPGTQALMQNTVSEMISHPLVLWAKHGVMARARANLAHAMDLIEYAETAADYECIDLASGGQADGLTPQEIRAVANSCGIEQSIY